MESWKQIGWARGVRIAGMGRHAAAHSRVYTNENKLSSPATQRACVITSHQLNVHVPRGRASSWLLCRQMWLLISQQHLLRVSSFNLAVAPCLAFFAVSDCLVYSPYNRPDRSARIASSGLFTVTIFGPFSLHFQFSVFFHFSKMNFRMSQE